MRFSLTLAAFALTLSSLDAQAGVITVNPNAIEFSFGTDDDIISPRFELIQIGEKVYGAEGTNNNETTYDVDWNLSFNPDPFVSLGFTATNLSAVTQTFTFSISVPIIPQLPSTLIGGSVGVTLTDANFDGSALVSSVPGIDVFTADIDGTPVLGLFTPPFALPIAIAGDTDTVSDVAGLPGPTLPGPAATTSIGITIKFNLSPGDSAGFTSFFVVEAIPEASTVTMMSVATLIMGGLGIRRFRRS